MRCTTVFIVLVLVTAGLAQDASQSASRPKSVTVPLTLDHNRIVVNVTLPLPDGSTQRVRAWVDNGNPDLDMSRRVAALLGLKVTCDDKSCSAQPPPEIIVGGMRISLFAGREVKISLNPTAAAAVMAPGMSAEINIPSSVLRNYDVLIDFPGRELTIAQPGSLKFKGVSSKAEVNPQNGLIQIPSQIENKKYNLALDLGSSISFLSEELFDKLASAHPGWPHMTGAVGPANTWGLDEELKWTLMRVDRLQYGPLHLTDVAFVDFPRDGMSALEKRAGVPTVGLLGSQALLNYRVGLDYAHSTVYFDIGRLFNFPDFDVVGLILRPEDDGRFTILGIADYDGKPSVPQGPDGVYPGDHLVAVDGTLVGNSTLGQVWALLQGSPGQERKLTIERGRKEFTVVANVQHFLGAESGGDQSKGKSKN
jgi:hypothetical protein